MSLGRGRRDTDTGPHLQVPRRRNSQQRSGISRLATSPSMASAHHQTTASSLAKDSSSNPNEIEPLLAFPSSGLNARPPSGLQTRSYSGTAQSQTTAGRRRSKITSGEALDLATGGASLRRPSGGKLHPSTSTPLPSSTFRPSRSFLLPTTSAPGLVSGGPTGGSGTSSLGGTGGAKLASTLTPLPKPKRTSKTSQRLVVLPSAPQTKPLTTQLVLLDEEQETSDDVAHPQVPLHPQSHRRIKPPPGRKPSDVQEQQRLDEEKDHRLDEDEHAALKRVREYKSAAERMSKEERKKAGYKRITAYCVAEGLKMKTLSGFLKREHNVHPRAFDEALYAMYHLPLLPGYGPQINVRSSAPPPASTEPSRPGERMSTLLERLEEAEENGYDGAYFPAPSTPITETLWSSQQRTLSKSNMSISQLQLGPESLGIPHIRPRDGGEDPESLLPGLVRPASVEEVRGLDGYVTSGSLPPEHHIPLDSGSYTSNFNPDYNYPSESDTSSTNPHTLRLEPHLHPSSERQGQNGYGDAQLGLGGGPHVLPNSFLLEAEGYTDRGLTSAEPQAPLAPASIASEDNDDAVINNYGTETDGQGHESDAGAFTDPGVYGPWPWSPKSRLLSSNAARDSNAVERGVSTSSPSSAAMGVDRSQQDDGGNASNGEELTDAEREQGDAGMAASVLTEKIEASPGTGINPSDSQTGLGGGNGSGSGSASDVTATEGRLVVSGGDPRLPDKTTASPASSDQVERSALASSSETYGPNRSGYEEQLAYERERRHEEEDPEYDFAEAREIARQKEYQRALERERERERERELDDVAEVVFFEYGVVVFFGLDEQGEKAVLEDVERAGAIKRLINEDEWEVEECHFAHDPQIAYPRIYNDFFTLKSRSHLLKLSIAHALAQSTLLARYESLARHTLSSPIAVSIPRQMAESGSLKLHRREALKLTGLLFKLRRDVNLVSNVLDVPELFWDEANLKDLYDSVRDYMEIGPRVESLNEKIGVASDFLDAIHDHLNNNAMDRITRIIIWLIVVAILVELGEIVARLTVHSTLPTLFSRLSGPRGSGVISPAAAGNGQSALVQPLSKIEALETLERMMRQQAS